MQGDVEWQVLNLLHHLLTSLGQVIAQLWPTMQIATKLDRLIEHTCGLLKHTDRGPVALTRTVSAVGLCGFGHAQW